MTAIETIPPFFEDVLSGKPIPLALVVSVLVCLIVILRWSSIKTKWYELRLHRAIRKLGKKVLRNVVVSDGLDGVIHIEYLVLTTTSILLLSIKRFSGVIFAGENIDLWTQVIDKRSFKFDNPLIQMDADIMSVRSLLSGSEVKGYMVFTDESEFPKGKPDQVVLLSDLKKKACNKSEQVPEKLQEDWGYLVKAVEYSSAG